jgi:predicted nucleic acid-binding protein
VILVDSSVWIDHLRGNPTAEVSALFRLIRSDADIVVGDLVLCEVLQGIPTERLAAEVEARLREFEVRRIVDDELAVEAARHYRRLLALGFTLRKTMDLLIGTYCIRHRHRLLHRDRDFDAMEQHLGLPVLRA